MASQKCFLGLLVNLNSWPQNPCYGPGFWLFPLPPLFFSQTLLTEENSIFAWALPQPMSWAFKTLRIGYIYISKTPTCWWQWWGSTGGHFRHSVSVWCGTDSTGDVVVWQEETTVQKRKWKKEIKKERDNTPNNRCVLGSDPARDKCCDVIWDGAGSTAWPACRWCDLIWSQEDALEGGMAGPKPPFYSRDPLSLYLSFSHMHAHKHPQSASFTAVFLALSILSVLPCCHPLSFAP